MKKILYTMSMAAAIFFTSCAQERGTTTEVADANENEKVNPSHLHTYTMPGTAAYATASGTAAPSQQPSAIELVTAYYTSNDPAMSYRSQNYKLSGTKHTTGKTATQPATPQSSTTMAPGSTTADAQGRDAVTSGKKSTSESKTPSTDKKKARLTPEQ